MSLDTTAKPSVTTKDGLPPELRRWAVAAIFTALAMASLDTAIANVALPAIAADLHVSPADVVWVVNIYQIALVATLLPLGALGEIVGHQRIYLGGLLLFTLASLGCALAWSLPSLTAARALQGLGASGLMSVNAALVRFVYPTHMLGRGFGHNALVVGTAFTFGPTIASAILAIGTWPWLFAINIPFGVIAIWIGLKTLPNTPRAKHAFDFTSAALTASCLGLFIIGIGSAAHQAPPALVGLELGAALTLGWMMIRRDADHPAPMLPIDLFRLPMFALSAATSVCSFAVQGLAFVSLPFYFEDVLHRSQVETGFFMTPWPLVVAIMAPIGGRLSDRYPVGILGGLGLVLLGIGMALLATLPPDPGIANIVWRMVVCGIGFGFFQTPNLRALMSSAPPHRSGSASSIVATARLTGQTLGAALAALCFGLAGHDGATLALALGAGFAALGSVMSFLRLTVGAPRVTLLRDGDRADAMDLEDELRLLSVLAGACLLLFPAALQAQTVWDMPTEYPQNAMPGVGLTAFTKHVAEASAGKLEIRPSFDAKAGIKSAGMLTAIAEGRVQAGDAFAGALEAEDPIFALPSLPFLVTSTADAKRLADIARPHLAAALQKKGLRLLYLTPWPPSGIWSKTPLTSPPDLTTLSIRTYDKTSTEVFLSVGAKAASISFADTMPKLIDGSINAVLSSGDGGAGRKLWEYLPCFSEITYSLPLSIASVNQAAYDGLSPDTRAAVDAASRQTESELWLALATRLEENYQRMRQNGVTIDSNPEPLIVEALRTGAAAAQRAWCTRSGPVCAEILDAFKAKP